MNLRLLLPTIASLLLWNSAWSAEDYQAPRTEWNQPDLQGVWNFSSDIPMQRPAQYGEREFLTEEEIAEIRARRAARDDVSDAAIPNGGGKRGLQTISGLKPEESETSRAPQLLSIQKMAGCHPTPKEPWLCRGG